MKQKIIMCIAVLMVLQSLYNSQLFAQNKGNVVNIISLNIPDSIEFKIKDAANVEAGKVNIVLVSGNKISKPTKFNAKPTIYKAGKGYTFTNETIFKATGFDKNFKAAKIRFIVGDQDLFFDLAKSEWE